RSNLSGKQTIEREGAPRSVARPQVRSEQSQPAASSVFENQIAKKVRDLNSELEKVRETMRKEIDRLKVLRSEVKKSEHAIAQHQENAALASKQISALKIEKEAAQKRFESSSRPPGYPLKAADRMLKDQYEQDQKTIQERIQKWKDLWMEASHENLSLTTAMRANEVEILVQLQALSMHNDMRKRIATALEYCQGFTGDVEELDLDMPIMDMLSDGIATAEAELSEATGVEHGNATRPRTLGQAATRIIEGLFSPNRVSISAQNPLENSTPVNSENNVVKRYTEETAPTLEDVSAAAALLPPSQPDLSERPGWKKIRELESELEAICEVIIKELDSLKDLCVEIETLERLIHTHSNDIASYTEQISRLKHEEEMARQRLESSSRPFGSSTYAILKAECDQDQKVMRERIEKWEGLLKQARERVKILKKAKSETLVDMYILQEALSAHNNTRKLLTDHVDKIFLFAPPKDTRGATDLITTVEAELAEKTRKGLREKEWQSNIEESTEA
ncbi:hypothetical protein FRC17_004710, partial [Serendipita sp. 399]